MSKDNKTDKLFVDYVSHDKDWRGVVSNELRCQESWHKDWGFLANDTSISNHNLIITDYNIISK